MVGGEGSEHGGERSEHGGEESEHEVGVREVSMKWGLGK